MNTFKLVIYLILIFKEFNEKDDTNNTDLISSNHTKINRDSKASLIKISSFNSDPNDRYNSIQDLSRKQSNDYFEFKKPKVLLGKKRIRLSSNTSHTIH